MKHYYYQTAEITVKSTITGEKRVPPTGAILYFSQALLCKVGNDKWVEAENVRISVHAIKSTWVENVEDKYIRKSKGLDSLSRAT